jgi:DTW domain-containing protein YfiP
MVRKMLKLERVRRVKSGKAYIAERCLSKRGEYQSTEHVAVFVEWCSDVEGKRKMCIVMKGLEPVKPEPIAGSGWIFWREVDPSNEKFSGAGTASVGLPGYTSGTTERE